MADPKRKTGGVNVERAERTAGPQSKRSSNARVMPKGPAAFLGLGNMGRPMAIRLAQAGIPLTVWSRNEDAVDAVTKHGAKAAKTAADCVQDARVIILMLSDADALREVLLAKNGLLDGLERGATVRKSRCVVIDMSTSGRAVAREVASRIERRRAQFVDAPVSGSVGPAAKGELVAMVGGDPRAVGKVEDYLRVLCKKIIHAGPVGAGQALKTILNGVGAHHFIGFASMLALGERAGLARETVVDAFTNGAFSTPSYVGKKAKVLAKDYSTEFSLALALKDAALVTELQHDLGLKLPVFRAIASELEAAVRDGLGDGDLFGIERRYAPEPKASTKSD